MLLVSLTRYEHLVEHPCDWMSVDVSSSPGFGCCPTMWVRHYFFVVVIAEKEEEEVRFVVVVVVVVVVVIVATYD